MKSKRLLAFLLTICMIGGMLPTVFAAEGDAGGAGVELVYDFACTALAGYNSEVTLASDKIGNLIPDSKKSHYWKFENLINVNYAGFQYNGLSFYTATKTAELNSNAVVLTIKVPASGTYNAEATLPIGLGYEERTDVYLVNKAVATEKNWNVTTMEGIRAAIDVSLDDANAAVKHIASYDGNTSATGSDLFAENVYLIAGDYYMFVIANEGSVQYTAQDRTYGTISKLVLKSEDAVSKSATVKYTFTAEAQNGWTSGNNGEITKLLNYTDLNRNVSSGEWRYSGYINLGTIVLYSDELDGLAIRVDNADYYGNNAAVLKMMVEESGIYKPSMIYRKYVQDGKLNVYFVPVSYVDAKWTNDKANWNLADIFKDPETKHVASQDGWKAGVGNSYPKEQNVSSEYDDVYFESGEYYVLMSIVEGSGKPFLTPKVYFYTKGITLTRQPEISLSAPEGAVKIGKTATLSTVLTNEAGTPITVGSFAYKSSNPSVAEVSNNGVVTGVAEGKTTIEVTATVCGVEFTDSVDITIEPELEYVALATSTSIAPNTINVIGNTYTRGTEVTVTALDKSAEGYTFRHWVRGTADNGEVVSKSPSYSFKLMTNTYLTAVYSEKTDDKIVEFYNGNGDYLETKTVVNNAVELPTEPKMTGFKFLQWIVGKNGNESIVLNKNNVTADVTYAVAEFGDNETVKFGVAGEDEEVVYDTPITRASSDGQEKAWYRNDALVGYGTSYTFNVWADVTSIEEKAITTKAPVVYLDPVAKDSARMIEYDAGGKEIVEVGILFGNGNNMSVSSCMYKATSQTNGGVDGHGQFTAKPANDTQTVARGYMIYQDGSEYKVVYSN